MAAEQPALELELELGEGEGQRGREASHGDHSLYASQFPEFPEFPVPCFYNRHISPTHTPHSHIPRSYTHAT